MLALFLIVGTLAAFSGGKEKPVGYNISMSILAVGCYACAVALDSI